MSEQRWTRDGRTAVVEVQDEGGYVYAPPGCVVITREVLTGLLTDAGFTPDPHQPHDAARADTEGDRDGE